jgi:flagellar basal body P-ring formation protein FlgA
MKQASNSLLTFNPIPFTASTAAPALPRVQAGTNHRHLTPFCFSWKISKSFGFFLPGFSFSPRSFVHSWLGEGRIRSLLYGFFFTLLAVCAVAFPVPLAHADEGCAIDLKDEVSIRSEAILLQDVADLHGPDRNAIERLSRIVLGAAPEFGSMKTLTRHQINERISSAMNPFCEVTLSGAAAVQIRMKGRPVDPGEISVLLKSYIMETTPWKESEIEIGALGSFTGIELPLEGAELRLSRTPPVLGRRSISALFEITQAGRTLRNFWIAADLVIHADAWVAAHRIAAGRLVEAGDLAKRSTLMEDLRALSIRAPEEVVGKIARRNFSPGDPIIREAFADPFLIKRGETVQLQLQREGIKLTSRMRAEEDGILGQVIRVRNLDFPAVLKAQVTGRLQVMLP